VLIFFQKMRQMGSHQVPSNLQDPLVIISSEPIPMIRKIPMAPAIQTTKARTGGCRTSKMRKRD
jgi:hypothetical protein